MRFFTGPVAGNDHVAFRRDRWHRTQKFSSGHSQLTQPASSNSIPVSWLQPLPEGYRIPIWRWILLPATALMLKRQNGVWINGTLELLNDEIRFSQSRLVKSKAKSNGASWSVPFKEIADVSLKPGTLSEILEIEAKGVRIKMMTVRAGEFVERLKAAVASS